MVIKHYFQRSLVNNLKNFWLQFQAKQRARLKTPGKVATPPPGYELIFIDHFEEVKKDVWNYGQPWGNFHADQPWWYWPTRTEARSIIKPTPEGLSIGLKNKPKLFERSKLQEWQKRADMPESWVSPWAAGLLSSRIAWQYGWFEATIKLPKDKSQWSAFWLAGDKSWPPEIDVFEAYSTTDPENLTLKPNIHWGKAGTWQHGKKDYGAPIIELHDPTDRFIQYAVHWTKDFIRIYFDGYLVQECTNKEALKQNSQPQYIILNHGLKNFESEDLKPLESSMLVKNVKVYQKI